MPRLDELISEFETAWTSKRSPWVGEYLVRCGDDRSTMYELVATDLEFRWRRNSKNKLDSDSKRSREDEAVSIKAAQLPTTPKIEDYLAVFPQLGSVVEVPAEIVEHEYFVRCKWGDRPSKEDYRDRFPGLSAEFREATNELQIDQTQSMQDTNSISDDDSTARASERQHAPSSPDSLPESFGRFRVLKRLGEGGMGMVYLAEDPNLERKVALKIPKFVKGQDGAVLARFRREAKAIAALHHPNICPVFEVADVDGVHYLAMAFIKGRPLTAYLDAKKTLEIRTIVRLVRKIALALEEAHRSGIVHRDLKPANIMIDARKEPIIMDFGLARREGVADTQLTTDGQMMGTPAYMPPEQVTGDIEAMGPGCDIYSLGAILYQLLTNKLPFEGDVLALLSQIAKETPVAPSAHRSDVPSQLDEICLRAMEKRPEDRFRSMQELVAALDKLQSDSAPPPADSSSQANRTPNGKSQSERGKTSKHRVTAFIALGVVSIAIVPASLLLNRGKTGNPPVESTTGQADSSDTASSVVPDGPEKDSPLIGTWRAYGWRLPEVGIEIEFFDSGKAEIRGTKAERFAFETVQGSYAAVPAIAKPRFPHEVSVVHISAPNRPYNAANALDSYDESVAIYDEESWQIGARDPSTLTVSRRISSELAGTSVDSIVNSSRTKHDVHFDQLVLVRQSHDIGRPALRERALVGVFATDFPDNDDWARLEFSQDSWCFIWKQISREGENRQWQFQACRYSVELLNESSGVRVHIWQLGEKKRLLLLSIDFSKQSLEALAYSNNERKSTQVSCTRLRNQLQSVTRLVTKEIEKDGVQQLVSVPVEELRAIQVPMSFSITMTRSIQPPLPWVEAPSEESLNQESPAEDK